MAATQFTLPRVWSWVGGAAGRGGGACNGEGPFGGAWQQETTRLKGRVPAPEGRLAEPASDPLIWAPLIDG